MDSKPEPHRSTPTVVPEIVATPDGFEVRIGARALGAGGEPVRASTRALAAAIATELRRIGPKAKVGQIALARLCLLAADVARHRAEMIDAIAKYAETDLLSYRATIPADLRARQDAAWQPLLDWAARRHGARLAVTAGLMPLAQAAAAVRPLRDAVAARTDHELAALHAAVGATGSLVLALAWLDGEIDAERTWELGNLDERFQVERWGSDAEAVAALAARRQDLADAARFLDLARRTGSV